MAHHEDVIDGLQGGAAPHGQQAGGRLVYGGYRLLRTQVRQLLPGPAPQEGEDLA